MFDLIGTVVVMDLLTFLLFSLSLAFYLLISFWKLQPSVSESPEHQDPFSVTSGF